MLIHAQSPREATSSAHVMRARMGPFLRTQSAPVPARLSITLEPRCMTSISASTCDLVVASVGESPMMASQSKRELSSSLDSPERTSSLLPASPFHTFICFCLVSNCFRASTYGAATPSALAKFSDATASFFVAVSRASESVVAAYKSVSAFSLAASAVACACNSVSTWLLFWTSLVTSSWPVAVISCTRTRDSCLILARSTLVSAFIFSSCTCTSFTFMSPACFSFSRSSFFFCLRVATSSSCLSVSISYS
mmetsp:Transcript_11859/g.27428  ORF Transcript_11859/g.27428 Transcript_11859/m.27428 type:complete len:252 (+) Transcript_11859:399-1154(+)